MPDLSIYKETIGLKTGLFATNPPVELNVRTILRGGTLTATTVGGSGSGNLAAGRGPDWDKFETYWAGSIKWTRTIPAGSLTIGIRSWDTGQVTPRTLRPVTRGGKQVIELKIADLCETNPLEWKEFEPRFDKDDVDFKWLFRLFEAKGWRQPSQSNRQIQVSVPSPQSQGSTSDRVHRVHGRNIRITLIRSTQRARIRSRGVGPHGRIATSR